MVYYVVGRSHGADPRYARQSGREESQRCRARNYSGSRHQVRVSPSRLRPSDSGPPQRDGQNADSSCGFSKVIHVGDICSFVQSPHRYREAPPATQSCTTLPCMLSPAVARSAFLTRPGPNEWYTIPHCPSKGMYRQVYGLAYASEAQKPGSHSIRGD